VTDDRGDTNNGLSILELERIVCNVHGVASWMGALFMTCNMYHLPFFVLSFMGYILKISYGLTLTVKQVPSKLTDAPLALQLRSLPYLLQQVLHLRLIPTQNNLPPLPID